MQPLQQDPLFPVLAEEATFEAYKNKGNHIITTKIAIHAALWDYAEKHHIKIEGLAKPKSDIHEGEEDTEEEY